MAARMVLSRLSKAMVKGLGVNRDSAEPPKATDIAIQGPGLADLLTEGDSQQVYALAAPPVDYDLRLTRIEQLLEALAGNQLTMQRSAASGGTVVDDGSLAVPHGSHETTDRDGHNWRSTDKTVIGDENV
ncbi:hypothetical protein JCM5353_006122 [Sporobolomyces roseus]